jgi:hypothetical protein
MLDSVDFLQISSFFGKKSTSTIKYWRVEKSLPSNERERQNDIFLKVPSIVEIKSYFVSETITAEY